MNTNNQCNHTDAIAKDMYETFIRAGDPYIPWDNLLPAERLGWRYVAEEALPIIGKHALGDVKDYLGIKASGAAVWWKKALYWAGAGIAGAVIGGLGMSLAGCGHNVDVTQGKTVICKGRFLPGAGTGAFVLFPGPAGNGCSARRAILEKVSHVQGCRMVFKTRRLY